MRVSKAKRFIGGKTPAASSVMHRGIFKKHGDTPSPHKLLGYAMKPKNAPLNAGRVKSK